MPINSRAPTADADVWKPHLDRAWPELLDWIQTPSDVLEERFIGSPETCGRWLDEMR